MIRPRLRRVVGRARAIGTRLVERLIGLEVEVAVDLTRRDVVKAPDLRSSRRLEHRLGPHDIGVKEAPWVKDRQRVVRLRREMDDRVDVIRLDSSHCGVEVADICTDHGDLVEDLLETPHRGGIGHDVVDDDRVLRVMFDPIARER